jgi:hypothetical protein
MHRALVSLIEELEAVDWYGQRVDAAHDDELARVLAHNRDEEKEHACMTLEWIRRHDVGFDRCLRQLLFGSGPITEHEPPQSDASEPTLGIGSLRERARDHRERPAHTRPDRSGRDMQDNEEKPS